MTVLVLALLVARASGGALDAQTHRAAAGPWSVHFSPSEVRISAPGELDTAITAVGGAVVDQCQALRAAGGNGPAPMNGVIVLVPETEFTVGMLACWTYGWWQAHPAATSESRLWLESGPRLVLPVLPPRALPADLAGEFVVLLRARTMSLTPLESPDPPVALPDLAGEPDISGLRTAIARHRRAGRRVDIVAAEEDIPMGRIRAVAGVVTEGGLESVGFTLTSLPAAPPGGR